jgi:hypothetical protein
MAIGVSSVVDISPLRRKIGRMKALMMEIDQN